MKLFFKWCLVGLLSFPLIFASSCFNMQSLKSKRLIMLQFYNLRQDLVDFFLKEFTKKRNYYNRPADEIYMTRKFRKPVS